MPGGYRILPAHGLVYVEYEGFATLADARGLYGAYMADPERRPEQKQLINLARIDDWERDLVGLMQFQADAAAGEALGPLAGGLGGMGGGLPGGAPGQLGF